MPINLAVIPREAARKWPDRIALRSDELDLSMTYAGLDDLSRRFASALEKLGVEPGDKVALMCPNIPQFTVAYFGILAMGATVVPLNVLLKKDEIVYHLEDSEATCLVTFSGFLDQAGPAFQRVGVGGACRNLLVLHPDPNTEFPGGHNAAALVRENSPRGDAFSPEIGQTAVILYTSGTTGHPKGAELTHDNLFWNVIVASKLVDYQDGDSALATLPLFHSFGQTCVQNASLYSGGTVAFMTRFDPRAAARAIEKHGLTLFHGVPTMYFHFLQLPEEETRRQLSSLRYCFSGGAAMPEEVLRAFEDKFGVPILEGYGLSETSPVACFNTLDIERKIGSIGVPVWGVQMKVLAEDWNELPRGEVGEIAIKGHCVMKGYYKRPEATGEVMWRGWFRSGDLGRQDEAGRFYIVDRKKEMIIRGGFNVYPREIEEVLYGFPGLKEAAVIGIPHSQHGEEIVAFVSFEDGSDSTAEDVIEYCKSKLAAYKYPRQAHVLKELPKGPTGKLLKREMRANLLDEKGSPD